MKAARSKPETAAADAPPPITVFLSMCTSELGAVRRKIADALASPRVHVVTMEHFDHEPEQLVEKLRGIIAGANAVIHVAGRAFGAAPAGEPRRSYTQMEWEMARKLGKKIYVCICEDAPDGPAPVGQSEEDARRQEEHRAAVRKAGVECPRFATAEEVVRWAAGLKIELQEMRGEYANYRRTFKRVLAGFAAVCVLLGGWVWYQQRELGRLRAREEKAVAELRGQFEPYRPQAAAARKIVAELEQPGGLGRPVDIRGRLRTLRERIPPAERGRLEEAQRLSEQLAAAQPADGAATMDAAYLSLANEKAGTAFRLAGYVAEHDPERRRESLRLLTLIALFQGNTEVARDCAQKAIALLPGGGLAERSRLETLLAFALLGGGDSAGGDLLLTAGRSIAKDDGANPDLLALCAAWLAYARDIRGDPAAARRLYAALLDQFARIKPRDREMPVLIRNQLAMLLDAASDTKGALDQMQLADADRRSQLDSTSYGAVLTRLNLAYARCVHEPGDATFAALRQEAASIREGAHGRTYLEFEAWDKTGRAAARGNRWRDAVDAFQKAAKVIEEIAGVSSRAAIEARIRVALSAFQGGQLGDCRSALDGLLKTTEDAAPARSGSAASDLADLAGLARKPGSAQDIAEACEKLGRRIAAASTSHAR